MNNHIKTLERLRACNDAIAWIRSQDNIKTAWNTCHRGDWMLWLASRLSIPRERLVLAACDCAELSLKHVPANEDRPRVAIATARRWAMGQETIENAYAAADAAYAAAYAADATYAVYAAARVAADAVYAAARAADDSYAAYAAERQAILSRCADNVRRYISFSDIETALNNHGATL